MYHFKKVCTSGVPIGKLVRCAQTAINHLTIKDMPHPKHIPVIGTKLALLSAGGGSKLHEYVDKRHKALGSVFKETLNNTEIVFLSDPQLMKSLFLNLEGKYPMHILPEPWVLYEKLYGSKRGLFFMNGEEWLNNRRVLNKFLLREDSDKWMENPIKLTVSNYVNHLKNKLTRGEGADINFESDLYKLSIDAIIALLGTNSTLQKSKHFEELLFTFSETVKRIFDTTTKLFPLPVTWYQKMNLKPWNDFKESVDVSLFLAQKIVKEMLANKDISDGLIKKLRNEDISHEIIVRMVADLVIAAGDTTSYTTLWTLLLLSNNDSTVKELREADYRSVKNIIRESMRLYPVAPFLTRILPKNCIIGPYTLNEGISDTIHFLGWYLKY